MKIKFQLASALAAGAVIAGGAMQGLHAQAKPHAFAVVENIVTDKDAYANKYVPAISKIISDAGGKFLVRGGRILPVKGDQPKVLSVIEIVEFENQEKARGRVFLAGLERRPENQRRLFERAHLYCGRRAAIIHSQNEMAGTKPGHDDASAQMGALIGWVRSCRQAA